MVVTILKVLEAFNWQAKICCGNSQRDNKPLTFTIQTYYIIIILRVVWFDTCQIKYRISSIDNTPFFHSLNYVACMSCLVGRIIFGEFCFMKWIRILMTSMLQSTPFRIRDNGKKQFYFILKTKNQHNNKQTNKQFFYIFDKGCMVHGIHRSL